MSLKKKRAQHWRGPQITLRQLYITLLFAASLLALPVHGGAIDPGMCVISGIQDIGVGVTNTITVQAYDSSAALTTGGDILFLIVEQPCDMRDQYYCEPDSSATGAPAAALPADAIRMTDNGDGTYQADFVVTDAGSISVGVEVMMLDNKIVGMYWASTSRTGTADSIRLDQTIDFDWGNGVIGDLPAGTVDNVSVLWQGYVKAYATKMYNIQPNCDDDCTVTLKGYSNTNGYSILPTLVQDEYYRVKFLYIEYSVAASVQLDWVGPSGQGVIANEYYTYGIRVKSQAYRIQVLQSSNPTQSVVVSKPPSHYIGSTYMVTMQNKDSNGNNYYGPSTQYFVTFSFSSQVQDITVQASTDTNGLYTNGLYTVSQQISNEENFTVSVTMTNQYYTDAEISGSPFNVQIVRYPANPEDSNMISGTETVGQADVDRNVVVEIKDIQGNLKTDGTDQVWLRVRQKCSNQETNICCTETGSVTGLPSDVQMTYTTNGQYEASYKIEGGYGEVEVGVFLLGVGGIRGSYYEVQGDLEPATCQIDDNIDLNWMAGSLAPLSATEQARIEWTGYIVSPTSGSYTFIVSLGVGDTLSGSVGGTNLLGGGSVSKTMVMGIPEQLQFFYEHNTGNASIKFEWTYVDDLGNTVNQVIPASAFISERPVWREIVTINASSLPARSTITEYIQEYQAGELKTIRMQSKNSQNVAYPATEDLYTVRFERSNGQVALELSTTSYDSQGIYSLDYQLTVVDEYQVVVFLTNAFTNNIAREIINSPVEITIKPGPIHIASCFYDDGDPPEDYYDAGQLRPFIIKFQDEHLNVYSAAEVTQEFSAAGSISSVTVIITHADSDDFASPIGVEDSQDWINHDDFFLLQATDQGDGTAKANAQAFKAGNYELKVHINGQNIDNSPYEFYRVKPAGIDVTKCVPVDVPETIQTGFTYSFYIQGRDAYWNNIKDTLMAAVGSDYSVTVTSQTDSDESFDGTITDAESMPGVFMVTLTVPLTLSPGDYDLVVMMGGASVPGLPTFNIEQCSNQLASELDFVKQAGETIVLDSIDFQSGDLPVSIELPTVAMYCLQEATVTLVSAKMITGSSEQIVNEDDLGTYGITLLQSGSSPSLEVSSEGITIDKDASFDIVLSTTVVEEPTWADTIHITVNVFAPEVDFEAPELKDSSNPKFDADSVSEKTLKLTEDGSGAQHLTPLIQDCRDPVWSKGLPEILGEDATEKFSVKVNLGQASDFLTYDPSRREFTSLEVQDKETMSQIYSVTIQIRNQKNKVSNYKLKISYSCEADTSTTTTDFEVNTYELRYDEQPPVPYIHSVDQFGEVKIKFNATMAPKVSLVQTNQHSQDGRRVLTSDGNDEVEVAGIANKQSEKFSAIHFGTFRQNGLTYPSVKVTVQPEDPESLCSQKLDFVWQCSSFTEEELIFNLAFTNPECISSSGTTGDLLKITFYDQRLFEDEQGKVFRPETEVQRRLKRQLPPDGPEIDVLEALATSASSAIVTTSLVNVITNFILQGSLSTLVNALKNLQIIVHVMLIQVYLAAHAEIFLHEIQGLIAFEIYDTTDIVQMTLQTEVNEALDVHFEAMGYETSDSIINSGPIALIIFIAPIVLLLIYVLSKVCRWPKCKAYFARQIDKTFFNRILVFIDGSFLILGVCCAVNIYQVYMGVAAKNASYIFAIVIIFSINPYLLLLLGYLCRKFPELESEKMKNRIGNAYIEYDLKGAGRPVLIYMVLSYTRRVALCFVITFGRSSIVAQLFFTNFCSILVISFIGIVRPLNKRNGGKNWLELWNEYTILQIYCHCVTQTDFVEDPRGRSFMGWSLIGLISLNIIVNFGTLLFADIKKIYLRIKRFYQRRKWLERTKLAQERQQKIDLYRKSVLEDFQKKDDALKDTSLVTQVKHMDSSAVHNQEGADNTMIPLRTKDVPNSSQVKVAQPHAQEDVMIVEEFQDDYYKDIVNNSTLPRKDSSSMSDGIQHRQTDSQREQPRLTATDPNVVTGAHGADATAYLDQAKIMTTLKSIRPKPIQGNMGILEVEYRPPAVPIVTKKRKRFHNTSLVNDFLPYSKKQVVITREMLQRLYDEEQQKLKEPSYPGGGQDPPYGPVIDMSDLLTLDFQSLRIRYSQLLQEAMAQMP